MVTGKRFIVKYGHVSECVNMFALKVTHVHAYIRTYDEFISEMESSPF